MVTFGGMLAVSKDVKEGLLSVLVESCVLKAVDAVKF